MIDKAPRSKLTPPELARQWGISPDKILGWIKSGELRALNVATNRTGRPRFLIDPADVAAFEAGRTSHPQAKVERRKKTPTDVIEFF